MLVVREEHRPITHGTISQSSTAIASAWIPRAQPQRPSASLGVSFLHETSFLSAQRLNSSNAHQRSQRRQRPQDLGGEVKMEDDCNDEVPDTAVKQEGDSSVPPPTNLFRSHDAAASLPNKVQSFIPSFACNPAATAAVRTTPTTTSTEAAATTTAAEQQQQEEQRNQQEGRRRPDSSV